MSNGPFADVDLTFEQQQEAARLRGEEEGRLIVELRRAREAVIDLFDFRAELEPRREPREPSLAPCPAGIPDVAVRLLNCTPTPVSPTPAPTPAPIFRGGRDRRGNPCVEGRVCIQSLCGDGSARDCNCQCNGGEGGRILDPIRKALEPLIGGGGGDRGGRGGPLPIGTAGTRLVAAAPARSPLVMLLVLAAIAGVGYFLYKRYKKGQT